MKNSTAQKLFLLGLAFGSPSAFADTDVNNVYVGAGYHLGTYDESGFPNMDLNAVKLEVGKYLTKNIALEGHLLFGAGSEKVDVLGTEVEVKLKNAISVFIKGDLPLSEAANVYGLLGVTKGKLEASVLGITASEDDSGLSYGIGAEIGFGKGLFVSGEYLFYLSESDYDYTGFNIGLSKKF
ncbi:MAG: porin family protein [Gammaproteobacteria bacterium]|nr:porin family protein [Gammaproteobacteria bacterium]